MLGKVSYVTSVMHTRLTSLPTPVTPPGQDSRLTRAMKDYYISKARETSDLPEWLFEERDRGALGQLRIANATPEDDLRKSMTSPIPVPSSIPSLPDPAHVAPTGIMVNRDNDIITLRSRKLSMDRKRSARVRFAEQVHPRREAETDITGRASQKTSANDNLGMVRTTAVPPVPRRNVRLADVNVHGRRPSAQGLPSGVRPQRPRVAAQ